MSSALLTLLAQLGSDGPGRLLAQGGTSVLSASNAPFWLWWVPPVLVTLVVAVVAGLVRHEHRRPVDSVRSVQDYARFRQALAHDDAKADADPTGGVRRGTTEGGDR